MSEAIYDFFIYNNQTYPVSDFDTCFVDAQPSIYEVIRIIEGIPLFLEEHYLRLKKSAEILGFEVEMDINTLRNNIEEVIKLNRAYENNIKIIVNDFNKRNNSYFFMIKSSYPEENQYSHGVKAIIYNSTRENPNAKVINKKMREDVNIKLKLTNSYEALLVNEASEVTEGSRSNIFFIKGDVLYTAPAKAVLMGITRARILELCKKHRINVVEAPIFERELSSFDAAFISGTSPKILPIASLEAIKYSTENHLLKTLIKIYDEEISTYIINHQSHNV